MGDDREVGDGSADAADGSDGATGDHREENVGRRFDRLPPTPAERTVEGRVSREGVLEYFDDRFGIPPETFDEYTFWEKGAGKIWIFAGEAETPVSLESLGMTCLRTRQEHWKPTTDFAQRFGRHADACVIDLDREAARRFAAGEDQDLAWDGDWGYLIAAHEVGVGPEGRPERDGDSAERSSANRSSGRSPREDAVEQGEREPLGIGLYVHGELRSMVPKGRQRDLR